ncbi:MAG: M56 family metallopeptidase [Planctomycetaceae bacterium]
MTPPAFLELIVSLSLQVTVIIGISRWLMHAVDPAEQGHRQWAACHLTLLAVTATAVLLPHLRLLPHSLITDRVEIVDAAAWQQFIGQLLLFLWLAGAAVSLLTLVLGCCETVRLVRRARPAPSLEQLLRTEGPPADRLPGDVQLLVSDEVLSPFCWHLQAPRLILPTSIIELTHDELRAVVRHELAHLRAGHALQLLLQRMVEVLYWFHPLVLWSSWRAELSREFYCDRAACRNAVETAAYLRSLLQLAEIEAQRPSRGSLGIGLVSSPSQVRLRVEQMLRGRSMAAAPRKRAGLGFVVFVCAAVLASLLWLPVDVGATSRSAWSPWPSWTANALRTFDITLRDYEVDGHRLRPHEQATHTPPFTR